MLRIQAVNFAPAKAAQNKSDANIRQQISLLNSTNQGDTVSFSGRTKRFMKVAGELTEETAERIKKKKIAKKFFDPVTQQNRSSLDKRIRQQEAAKMKREERILTEESKKRFDDDYELEEDLL